MGTRGGGGVHKYESQFVKGCGDGTSYLLVILEQQFEGGMVRYEMK